MFFGQYLDSLMEEHMAIVTKGQQILSLPYFLQKLQPLNILVIKNQDQKENSNPDKTRNDEPVKKPTEETDGQTKNDPVGKSQFDASAVKLDLTMSFSAENLKKNLTNVLNVQKQLPDSSKNNDQKKDYIDKAEIVPFIAVDLSVKAERVQKEHVGSGNGSVQDIHIRQSRTIVSVNSATYRLDQIKLQIQRRQSEQINAQSSIVHRDGYRIIRQRISQRYREDLSLKAELLDKFSAVAQKVEESKPETTDKFLNTTDKLVQNTNVSGKTISKFFNVVDSYVDKTKQALHGQIDKFMDSISKDFNVNTEKLNEMSAELHSRVDQFFDGVNKMLGSLKDEALKTLVPNDNKEPAPIPNQVGNVTQIA